MRVRHVALALLLSAVPSALFAQQARPTVPRLDSLVLERTACMGDCPAYRLTVHADGRVRFVSANAADRGRSGDGSIGTATVSKVWAALAQSDFDGLPLITTNGADYCRMLVTDAPSVAVTTYRAAESRRVSYYLGCGSGTQGRAATANALQRLSSLADSVDAWTGAKQWIRSTR